MTSVSPRSSSQRQKFYTDDTNHHVYIINLVVMGFQIYICPILRVFWLSLVKCCVHLAMSPSETASSREDYITQILTVLLEILRVYI